MNHRSSALGSSKNGRRIAADLDGKLGEVVQVVELTANVVNAHTQAFFSRGFFGKLKYLVFGK